MLNLLNRIAAVVFVISIALFALTTQAQYSQLPFGPEIPGYKLYGIARQTDDLGKALFYCGLYLQYQASSPMPKQGDAAAILAYDKGMIMEFRAASNISQRNLVNSWMSAIAVNNPEKTINNSIRHIVKFKEFFRFDIEARDNIRYHYQPETETIYISVNGNDLGEIKDSHFFKLLLNMWQGDVPPDSDFKSSIIGEKVKDSSYRNDVDSSWANLFPDPERIAFVKSVSSVGEVKENTVPIVEKKALSPQNATEKPPTSFAKPAVEKTVQPTPPAKVADQPSTDGSQLTKNVRSSPMPENDNQQRSTHTLSTPEVKSDEAEKELAELREELIAHKRYATLVFNKLQREIKYPAIAYARNQEGVVEIDLIIERDGSVITKIRKPSRVVIFNKVVALAVERAKPFPEIPPSIKTTPLHLTVPPLKFTVR